MTIRYVDPAASGNNDGTSWTHAWTTLQSAYDTAVAGDQVYCRGTETLSSILDIDTNSGSLAAGFVSFIGCNASGIVDGTRYVVDANSTAVNVLKYANSKGYYYWHENIEFKNATSHGVNYNDENASYSVFYNCTSHNNGSYGWLITGINNLFVKCQSYNNNTGFYLADALRCVFSGCVSYGASAGGFTLSNSSYITLMSCISYNNGSWGFYLSGPGTSLLNSISDDNVIGVSISTDIVRLLYNRITNNTTGIDFSSETTICGWNYLHGNTTDLANPSAWSDAGIYACYITEDDGTNTNKADTDVDDGYVDQANQDYRLKADRTYNGDGSDVIPLGIGS